MASVTPNRIEAFAVTVAAGTTQAAAVETATSFADGSVVRVELDVPDGHAGLTGIQILWAHSQVIPTTQGTFLVANDHNFGWDLLPLRYTGKWSVKCFNTDIYQHTFYVRYSVLDYAFQQAAEPLAPLDVATVLV